jgi:molybdenum cofactor biosynthesis enzyme
MCKAVNKNMVIGDIKVVAKAGGKRDFDLRGNL